MKPSAIRVLWLIYFLCLIPALFSMTHRIQFDRGFQSVALVADYVQLLELAQTENLPVDDVLRRVRDEAGITRLAILEDTPQFLAQRGLCTIVEGVGWPGWKTPEERQEIERNRGREPVEARPPEANWPLLTGLPHDMTSLIFTDPDTFQRVARVAEERYPSLVRISDQGGLGGVVSLAGEPKIVLEWGLGFDPMLVAGLRAQGFKLYPRLRDYAGYSRETVTSILENTAALFPDGWIVFDGDTVLGSHGFLKTVGDKLTSLSQTGWKGGVGWVEFAEQEGAHSLAWQLYSMTARVHSIEDEEMEVITPERAVARYLRAVRERAVRIVYLKPFLLATDQANRVDKSVSMFAGVKVALESRGFTIGEPSRIPGPIQSSIITRLAAMLALAMGLILLVHVSTGRVSIPLALVILVGVFVVCLGVRELGVKVVTLGLSLVLPTLALAWLVRQYQSVVDAPGIANRSPLPYAIGMWLGAVAITITGAFLITASLINQRTLLEIDAFSGVKIALYLPILIALVMGVLLILPPGKQTLGSALAWLFNVPVRIWHVLLGFVALVALFIMLDRSGNFPVIDVADWENRFRGWFETVLYARPRTKEAFIGHPALVLGLYLGLSRFGIRRSIAYAGLVIGSIALTSLTNTFCHTHTPLELSLYRTLAGAVIGGIIGIVAGVVVMGVYRLVVRWTSRIERNMVPPDKEAY